MEFEYQQIGSKPNDFKISFVARAIGMKIRRATRAASIGKKTLSLSAKALKIGYLMSTTSICTKRDILRKTWTH
jgi:hypothetical protein